MNRWEQERTSLGVQHLTSRNWGKMEREKARRKVLKIQSQGQV